MKNENLKSKILSQKPEIADERDSKENLKQFLLTFLQEPDRVRTPVLQQGEVHVSSLEDLVLKETSKNIKINSSAVKEETTDTKGRENDKSKVFPFQANPHIR